MKRIIIGITIFVVCVGFILCIFIFNKDTKQVLNQDNNKVKIEEVSNKENNSETNEVIEENFDSKIEETKSEKNFEQKQEETSNNNKKEEKIDNKQQVIEKNNKVEPSNEINQEQNVVQKKDEVKINNPWDNLGITEYDYYNKPAHSWAELDFKVSNYGSREATLNACKEYGNSYISENGGGYFCDSVNSYSGDYLGEDIDFY